MQYARIRSLSYLFFISGVLIFQLAAQPAAAQLPAARFLYSTDYMGGKVHGYRVNATTGAITPTGQNPQWAHWGPTRAASDKGGYRLYVVNQGSKDLNAYFIYRNNGYLVRVPGAPFSIGQVPTDVKVHPSGHYVFVAAKPNWIFAFALQGNGSLAPVPGSPFSTVNKPQTLVLDPQGKFLYVSSYPATSIPATSEVDGFSINAVNGALTPIPGSPFPEPNSDRCANGAWDMAVHPSGKFLVIPNMCEGIVVYGIERSTGTLNLVKGSPFPVPYPPGPVVESIAMDPQGQYFWVSTEYCHSGCSQSTDTWKLNTQTGVPTYLESGPSACGLLTRADPSGKFVFVIGDTQGSGCADSTATPGIWGLGVNRSKGTVKNIVGSPFASPNSDWFLTDGLVVTP